VEIQVFKLLTMTSINIDLQLVNNVFLP